MCSQNHCPAQPCTPKTFMRWSHSRPVLASPVPAQRCRSSPLPTNGTTRNEPCCPEPGRGVPPSRSLPPHQVLQVHVLNFSFFLVYIFCTSVSPAGARSSALFPRPLGCGPDTLPGWSAFLLGPGTAPLAAA